MFGIMPDWNPAEIIGVKPKPLAVSLYKELITDNIWAYQRDNYGYKNLRSFPLLINFYGIPYIDVKTSFNSFIPKKINEKLTTKLVDFYMKKLRDNPELHDKIEFDIVFSCNTFVLDKKLKNLKKFGFSKNEISILKNELIVLTNDLIDPENGIYKKDVIKIGTLEKRREKLIKSNLNTIHKIYWLIEDTKRFGTLPFAGLARAGFIAQQILNSLISKVITDKERDNFLLNVNTITSEINKDLNKLNKKNF